MKILHTSDWHIGSALYGRKRYDESEQFLHWLVETIKNHSIETLLVAGDIFDTSTPSNTAQELYYRFLNEVSRTTCRHVIVTGGNHDSPSFLDAPKALLKAFNVHVVGSAAQREEDEVLVLKDAHNNPEVIVCAVPFLRDRDVRQSNEGESYRDKENRLVEGIISHYQKVYEEACKERNELGKSLPIIGMGHLFIAGSSIYKRSGEMNGERDLYVGSLGQVRADILHLLDTPQNLEIIIFHAKHLADPQIILLGELCQHIDDRKHIRLILAIMHPRILHPAHNPVYHGTDLFLRSKLDCRYKLRLHPAVEPEFFMPGRLHIADADHAAGTRDRTVTERIECSVARAA